MWGPVAEFERSLIHERQREGIALARRQAGMAATDALVMHLAQLSGQPVPAKYKRQRSQLVDAMLDGHFHFGNKKIAHGAGH